MYALFVEVELPQQPSENDLAEARRGLQEGAAEAARAGGALSGYWLAPIGTRGISVTVFDDEATALRVAERLPKAGEAGPFATFKTIEVREVLASVGAA